ncbi:hypothetical protein SprV_0301174700 [Sparganum proliferum]
MSASPLPPETTSWEECPVCRRTQRPSHEPESASSGLQIHHHHQSLRLPLISGSDEAKDKFYGNLHAFMRLAAIHSTALDLLRRARRQQKEWFDGIGADIRNLRDEKNGVHEDDTDRSINANEMAFFRCRRPVQQRLRRIQDSLMACKTEGIQGYADLNGTKNSASIKAIYGSTAKETVPLLSSDRTTLRMEKSQILKRWTEHFKSIFNRPPKIFDAAIGRLLQLEMNTDLDLPPSLPETTQVIYQLSSEKASGFDVIPTEGLDASVCGNCPELPIVDNCAPNSGTDADIQRSLDLFASRRVNFGLTIDTDKSAVMYRSSPDA